MNIAAVVLITLGVTVVPAQALSTAPDVAPSVPMNVAKRLSGPGNLTAPSTASTLSGLPMREATLRLGTVRGAAGVEPSSSPALSGVPLQKAKRPGRGVDGI